MKCKLCDQEFVDSQSECVLHFTIKNNCPQATLDILAEIWNKSSHHFDQSHWKKIQTYLAERGWADKRGQLGRQGGEEDEDDPKRVANDDAEESVGACEVSEGGGVDVGRGVDDDRSADVPINVEREAECDRGALRAEKRAVPDIVTEEYNMFRRHIATCPPRVHLSLPNLHRISGDGIVEQHKGVAEMLTAMRRDVAATGATILTDGRKSITTDQIVNFLADGSSRAYLLRTVLRDRVEQDKAEVVVRRWKMIFDDFGVGNVNVICTDSAGTSIAYFEGVRRTNQRRELTEESYIYLRQQAGSDRQLYQDLRTALREFHSSEGDYTYGDRDGDRDAKACRGEKETSAVGQCSGMESMPGVSLRRTGDDIECPPIEEMDVKTDVERRNREERQRELALAQCCPTTLDAARALETGVASVDTLDRRDICGTGEQSYNVEEGGGPQCAHGDGGIYRQGLDPIRGEDDDEEGGGDGPVGGGAAPYGGTDAVAQRDVCEEEAQTTGGGHEADAGGGRAPAAHVLRCADEGHREPSTVLIVSDRPDAGVQGVYVLPSGGDMPAAVLEFDGREDLLVEDQRGQMEDDSRRVLADPPLYVPCSPSVSFSMTGVTPLGWDPAVQMESIRATCATNTRSWDSASGPGTGTGVGESRGLDSLSPQSRMKTRPHGLGSVRKVT
ncbi:hypothetical protein CBR_g8132 [Chara braunii]|uniref:Uncharacterized protein n=1 Tax=Chara braunii TaxID=69332 RepID=A0A388KLB3_CHABU|nr:hypothetical protein CBR_g8132 [Chara braunii]|eukprot:GBG70832.1 hypothetical protein CBR_g8132 [Chara braunii]